MNQEKKWLKQRGYIHLTNPIRKEDYSKNLIFLQDKDKISKHAFFPLLHKKIPQRRFKIVGYNDKHIPTRKHKKYNKKTEKIESTKKMRPIHYATHIDSMIYAYYSNEIIQEKYEEQLAKTPDFSDCITAYRRIKTDDGLRNKNNIDFAKDVFDYIKRRGECCALAFDIESFFTNLDHKILKKAWSKLLDTSSLPSDHYNLFKSITNYSYILLNDLKKYGRGFDEQQLAHNRKKGIRAFFDSPNSLKEKIKAGELRVCKNKYHNKKNKESRKIRGIPQGLPISSMLANLYLLEFDKIIYQKVMVEMGGFYRRYSDDIVVVCDETDRKSVQKLLVDEIKKYNLKISLGKTEICIFKKQFVNEKKVLRSTGVIIVNNQEVKKENYPFRYLGFEFYGDRTLIKSANLSKFYRRMIYAIKTKAKRIKKIEERDLVTKAPFYKRKLYRIYSFHGKKSRKMDVIRSRLIVNKSRQSFEYEKKLGKRKFRGNYLAYVERASKIMKEPAIKRQLRNHWKILKDAINRRIYGKI